MIAQVSRRTIIRHMESETHPVQDVDERFKVVPDGMPEVTGEDEEHGGHEVPGALLTCQLCRQRKT